MNYLHKQATIILAIVLTQQAFALSLNITGTAASCPNYLDGTAMANATGGVEPYTYLWNTGATTQQITGLVPGQYSCTVTDAMSTTALDFYEVNEETLWFHYGVQTVQGPCSGGCSGQMTFDTTMAFGGVAPFTFDPPPSYWVGDVAYFTDLCPWEFNYTITDATGCTENTGVPMSMMPYLLGQVNSVVPGCNGAPNGSASYQLTLYDIPPGMEWPVTFIADDGIGNTFPTTNFEMWGGTVYGTITELPPGEYTLSAEFAAPCGTASLSIPLTIPDMGPDCGNVQGIVWYDMDHDCIIDGSEARIPYRVNSIWPGGYWAITNAQGQYSAGLNYGNYTITQVSADLDQICPSPVPQSFILDAGNQNVYINLGDTSNIAFDLAVDCYLGTCRPGFETYALVRVQNGSIYASDLVTVSCDYSPEFQLISSDIAPDVNQPGHLEWQVSSIGGYGYADFHFVLALPPDQALVGTNVSISGNAVNDGPENVVLNNSCTSSEIVVASFDPNDKHAATSSGSSTTQYFLDEDQWIDYTIRFQNTGTDTAFNVVIRDTLELDLDPATLEILSASHAFEPAFETGRVLKFTFADILLPDSNVNETASHGFVRYRIRPRADITVGEVITNSADIYFDFNAPVTTAPSELFVELSTSLQGCCPAEAGRALRIFPNPSSGELRVVFGGGQQGLLQADVLSLDGRVVMRKSSFMASDAFDIRSLAAGTYLLRLRDAAGAEMRAPFVKH